MEKSSYRPPVRRELLAGVERLAATSEVLQRARLADPLAGMWEAADVQWWWGRVRATDELALPAWFDEVGPVAAVGLLASGDRWQVDAHVVPGTVELAAIWDAAMAAAAEHGAGSLELLVQGDGGALAELALASGFERTDEQSGTSWMDAGERPAVEHVAGFTLVDRTSPEGRPHPMVGRNGEPIESRLRQCSLYDPALDLAVEDAAGTVAGYALFWADPTTGVGLLEPMRVEDAFQRRGLARMLLTHGLDRLARAGCARLKVGFVTEATRALYLGAGFTRTSSDQTLTRP
jgi:GNAT superfamily N-acetyltransferase